MGLQRFMFNVENHGSCGDHEGSCANIKERQ